MSSGHFVLGNKNIVTGDISATNVNLVNGSEVTIERPLTIDEEREVQQNLEIRRIARAVVRYTRSLQLTIQNENTATVDSYPYRALVPYSLADAAMFFGRDEAKRDIFQKVHDPTIGRFFILHSDSGVGKTSLLKAGLAADLLADDKYGHLPLYVRPLGERPDVAIKRTLLPDLTPNDSLHQLSLAGFLTYVLQTLDENGYLFIFLDQFEEFLIRLKEEQERHLFIESLAECLDNPSLVRIRFIISVRSRDFGYLATYTHPLPLTAAYSLQPFTYEQAKKAIIKPAEQKHIIYEDGLVDEILIQLQNQPLTENEADLIPHEVIMPANLQLVCWALYHGFQTAESYISYQQFEGLGGVPAILRNHLQRTLNQYFQHNLKLARDMLKFLITPEQTRDQKTKQQIINAFQDESITELLHQLSRHRLINEVEREVDGENFYELAHDYLIEQISLTKEEQALRTAQDEIDRALPGYLRSGILLDDKQLSIIEPFEALLGLTEETRGLLIESRADIEERNDRDKKRTRNIRFLLIGLIIAFIFIIIIGLAYMQAEQLRGRAEQEATVAIKNANATVEIIESAIIEAEVTKEIAQTQAIMANQTRAIAEQERQNAEAAAATASVARATAVAAQETAIAAQETAEAETTAAMVAKQTADQARDEALNAANIANQEKEAANNLKATADAEAEEARLAQQQAEQRRQRAEEARQEAEIAQQEAESAQQQAELAQYAAEEAAAEAQWQQQQAEEELTEVEALRAATQIELEDNIQFSAILKHSLSCELDIGLRPKNLTYDGENIWVVYLGNDETEGMGKLVKFRASDCAVLGEVAIRGSPVNVIYANEYLWITSSSTNEIYQINPETTQLIQKTCSMYEYDDMGQVIGCAKFRGAGITTYSTGKIIYSNGYLWIVLNKKSPFSQQAQIRRLEPDNPNSTELTIYDTEVSSIQDLIYYEGNLWFATDETVSKIDTQTDELQLVYEGFAPDQLLYHEGYIWGVSDKVDSLFKFDVNSAESDQIRLEAGSSPNGLVIDQVGDMWITNSIANTLIKISANLLENISEIDFRELPELPMPQYPSKLLFDGVHLWVICEDDEVIQRITTTSYFVGQQPVAIEYHKGFLWVVSRQNNSLTKISINGIERTKTYPTQLDPVAIQSASDSLWVAGDKSIAKFRIQDTEIFSDLLSLDVSLRDLTYDGERVWGISEEDNVVIAINQNTHDMMKLVITQPTDIIFDGQAIWVSSASMLNRLIIDNTGDILRHTYSLSIHPEALLEYDSMLIVAYNAVVDQINQIHLAQYDLLNGELGPLRTISQMDLYGPPNLITDGQNVWLSTSINDKVALINLLHEEGIIYFETCYPSDMIYVEEAIWVVCELDGIIQKLYQKNNIIVGDYSKNSYLYLPLLLK